MTSLEFGRLTPSNFIARTFGQGREAYSAGSLLITEGIEVGTCLAVLHRYDFTVHVRPPNPTADSPAVIEVRHHGIRMPPGEL